MNNDIDIAELKRLHAAATGGKWGVWKSHASVHNDIILNTPHELRQGKNGRVVCSCEEEEMEADKQGKRDAKAIAALHNAFHALIARLEAAEAAGQWRLIEEAPKDGKTRILGCGLYNHPFDPAMAESVVFAWVHFNRILGEWVDCHGYYFTPTHYMPLPAPPEAAR